MSHNQLDCTRPFPFLFGLAMTLVFAFLSSLPPSARADLMIFANSTSNLGNGPPARTGSAGMVSDTAGGTLGTDITESRSSATFGQLRAYSSIADGTGGTTNGTFAWNTLYFRDDFLFKDDGRTGTAGTVEMKFKIDGSLLATRAASSDAYVPGSDDAVRAFAEYRFTPGVNQSSQVKFEGMRTAQYAAAMAVSRQEGTPFLGIEQTYVVPFTYGTKLEGVELRLFVGAEGFGGNGFASNAIADLEHTANWVGFGAVRDANGNLVTDYSFSSGSGFNYVQGISAVPEPSSCILLLGAAGIEWLRRKRNRRLTSSSSSPAA